MSQATEEARPNTGRVPSPSPDLLQADWELDYYSRPILEPDGKKRWELLIARDTVMAEAADRANRARSLLRQQEQNAG